jgi:hypothetical protein
MNEPTRDRQASEDDDAAQLVDRLLEAADGGRKVLLGQYEASILLALLGDQSYTAKIMRAVEELERLDSR